MTVEIAFHLELLVMFKKAADAGYGIMNGFGFEAIPGLENAAADYIEDLMNKEFAE